MQYLYINSKKNKSIVYAINNDQLVVINTFPLLSNENIITKYPNTFCLHSIEYHTFSFWEHINKSHNPLDWVSFTKSAQNTIYQFNTILEKILLFLQIPQIENRNFQEGVTLLLEENNHIFGFLIFQNNIYGIFEHNRLKLSAELLQKNLEEFRFGWLPHEEVIKQEGYGCILKNIPAEAEGFRPIYIVTNQTNPHSSFLQQFGKKIELPPITTLISLLS